MDNADRASSQQVEIDKSINARAKQNKNAKGREDCIDCEAPINKLRLEANPQAIRCVGCQEAFEAHRRIYK